MIVKVCGMREKANLGAVVELGVDLVGFIEYPPSPRYAPVPPASVGVERVGVFVDERVATMVEYAREQNFNYLQLHGDESPEVCDELREAGLRVIKAISVATREDIAAAHKYDGRVDMLLFDTKCSVYGGSGISFDWSILDSYHGESPFLLSGGIDDTMAAEITAISHPRMVGVDLNSRFEIEPACKDIEKLEKFIKQIR